MIKLAFTDFARTRTHTGKISPRVLLQQLRAYQRYSVEAVVEGLARYTASDWAGQGRGERYALGIVRGVCQELEETPITTASTQKVAEKEQKEARRKGKVQQARKIQQEVDTRTLELMAAQQKKLGKGKLSLSEMQKLRTQATRQVTGR